MARTLSFFRPFILVMLLPPLACGGGDSAASDAPEAATAEAPAAGLLDPNLASVDELAAIPGLSGEVARALVDGRPYLRAADFHALLAGQVGEEAARAAYQFVWPGINLNDVSQAEILLIPGVGDRMAHEFEEYRPYEAMAEFHREIGKYVDDDEVARLARYVFVPIDLNTATREQILAIPGVGERMAHEFEEYRPYVDMAQFRREIGKYVDEDEVARLERYVTIE